MGIMRDLWSTHKGAKLAGMRDWSLLILLLLPLRFGRLNAALRSKTIFALVMRYSCTYMAEIDHDMRILLPR